MDDSGVWRGPGGKCTFISFPDASAKFEDLGSFVEELTADKIKEFEKREMRCRRSERSTKQLANGWRLTYLYVECERGPYISRSMNAAIDAQGKPFTLVADFSEGADAGVQQTLRALNRARLVSARGDGGAPASPAERLIVAANQGDVESIKRLVIVEKV